MKMQHWSRNSKTKPDGVLEMLIMKPPKSHQQFLNTYKLKVLQQVFHNVNSWKWSVKHQNSHFSGKEKK